MAVVDFATVSTAGLELSPHAVALAGLRANEARYFSTKYGHAFATVAARSQEGRSILARVTHILAEERGIVIDAEPLMATRFTVDGVDWSYVFYASGLVVNVLYALDESKRAVGFKLADGMEVPAELAAFKFARQRSKLAGVIRGSYFVIRGAY